MIDFILFTVMLLLFSLGFWCGKKFGSVKASIKALTDWFDKLMA